MIQALTKTNLSLHQKQSVYNGKVRDVYTLPGDLLVMVATDRISAFDVVLPKGIPFKGELLNTLASYHLDATKDIIPNWKIATPDPMVTVGHRCDPLRLEMIIRGYITGSAWRAYEAGERMFCGVTLPDGLKENQRLERPIITPTTKAEAGHDENISREEIIAQKIVSAELYTKLEDITHRLFERGTKLAKERGLILVDTKYEFGLRNGELILIDEIHTPDSSRYFYADTYEELFVKGLPQRQLSKEFVRKWLVDNGFSGKEGEVVPKMTDEYCLSVTERYTELYQQITGERFVQHPTDDLHNRIERNLKSWLQEYTNE